ncbi:hypothetical protein BDU57DRAFT_542503 [Ampelomyces quisqualis]|uniref:Uncharacterized protein n=1 Tax=Ampelomyces quisqualis TaxID=50730 RepID=A0A6A5QAP5_AMPQU|nr:hypothetical protein BDU57DRAFT_542503 [Ampelomyces quisqualis]
MRADYTAIPLSNLSSHASTQPDDSKTPPSNVSLLPQEPAENNERSYKPNERSPNSWTPLMLRRWALLTISLILLALIVSLEVVLKVATNKHGFGPIDSDLVYLWTYGPTAVFTLVAAFWTQIDYRTRHLQPWRELAKRPQPASKNLLLDYISRNPLSAFMSSVKHRHWPVSIVLLGSLLLKIVIVLSTGLLAPRFSNLPIATRMEMVEQFQFGSLDERNVDVTSASLYTSLLLKQVPFPPGTNTDFVAEKFQPYIPTSLNSFNMSARVRTMTAGLDCEVASVSDVQLECPRSSSCRIDYMTMTAATDNCRISQFPTNNRTLTCTSPNETNLGPQDKHDYGAWYGDVFLEQCNGDGTNEDRGRIVIVSLYKKPGPVLTNSSILFCKPSVNFSHSTVTFDRLGTLIDVADTTSIPMPSTMTTTQIDKSIRASMDYISDPEGADVLTYGYLQFRSQPFIRLLLLSQNSTSIEDASNSQLLMRAADAVYRGLVTQLAKQYLLVANATGPPSDLRGSLSYVHQRLFVQVRTLRIMEAILGIVILFLFVLAFQQASGGLMQDVTSIARFASAMIHSNSLNDRLHGTGTWSLRHLGLILRGSFCSCVETMPHDTSVATASYKIDTSQQIESPEVNVDQEHWRPMILSWYSRVAVLFVPLALIVALEVVFRRTQRNEGLLDVVKLRDVQLGTAFAPAVIMALLKLLYSGFDFELRIIDPYVQLSKIAADSRTLVLDRTIYTWKTDAFWMAIKNKRFAVGASTLSVMLASFLTVAVSGLFVVVPVARMSHAEIVRTDTFSNYSQVFENMNGSTTRTSRLAAYDILNDTVGTFQSYILPTLSLPPYAPDLNITSILGRVPVRQGRLDCTLVPRNQIILNPDPFGNRIDPHWPDLTDCTALGINNLSATSVMGRDKGLFATWETSTYWVNSCPSAWGIYGTWSGNQTKLADITVIQCWGKLLEAEADRTRQSRLATAPFLIVPLEEVFGSDFSNSGQTKPGGAVVVANFGATFKTFLRTETPNVLNTELLKEENFGKLSERIQKVYGLVVAQTLNSQGRNKTAAVPDRDRILNGTATSYVLRLQQNRISTRILQGILASMFVCALIVVSTLRLTGVLPKNPCSIAALASLVVGSRMMADLPPESQYMNDREFEALFRGQKYMMGWSVGADGKERYGIDVDERVGKDRDSAYTGGAVIS